MLERHLFARSWGCGPSVYAIWALLAAENNACALGTLNKQRHWGVNGTEKARAAVQRKSSVPHGEAREASW